LVPVVAGRDFLHNRAYFHHLAEAFMPDDQELETVRRRPVLRRIDLFVCAVYADAQHLYKDAPAIGHIGYGWLGHFGEMNAIRLSGIDGNRSHHWWYLQLHSRYDAAGANYSLQTD